MSYSSSPMFRQYRPEPRRGSVPRQYVPDCDLTDVRAIDAAWHMLDTPERLALKAYYIDDVPVARALCLFKWRAERLLWNAESDIIELADRLLQCKKSRDSIPLQT